MADMNQLLSNPLFVAGLSLLSNSQPRAGGANPLEGLMPDLMRAQQLQALTQQQQMQMRQFGRQEQEWSRADRERAARESALGGFAEQLPEGGLARSLMSGDPAMQNAVIGAMLKPNTYKSVPEGGSLVNTTTGEFISGAPKTIEIKEGDKVVTYQVDPTTLKRTKVGESPRWNPRPAPSALVNITNAGPKKFDEETAKLGASSIMDEFKTARTAADNYRYVEEGKRLLNAGAFTGKGAKFRTSLSGWLATAGFDVGDEFANTQAYAANVGNLVGQVIKQFGSGTGLSDADREYAERIAGGDVELDEKALRRLLSMQEKAAKVSMDRYGNTYKSLSPEDRAAFHFDISPPQVDFRSGSQTADPDIQNLQKLYPGAVITPLD